jgi:hypothetical protein
VSEEEDASADCELDSRDLPAADDRGGSDAMAIGAEKMRDQ